MLHYDADLVRVAPASRYDCLLDPQQQRLGSAGEIAFAVLGRASQTIIRNYPATSSEPLTLLRVVDDNRQHSVLPMECRSPLRGWLEMIQHSVTLDA